MSTASTLHELRARVTEAHASLSESEHRNGRAILARPLPFPRSLTGLHSSSPLGRLFRELRAMEAVPLPSETPREIQLAERVGELRQRAETAPTRREREDAARDAGDVFDELERLMSPRRRAQDDVQRFRVMVDDEFRAYLRHLDNAERWRTAAWHEVRAGLAQHIGRQEFAAELAKVEVQAGRRALYEPEAVDAQA